MRISASALLLLTVPALSACAGTSSRPGLPEGASSPDEAVEVFLRGAQDANQARNAGRLDEADRAYDRMSAVFGTERGSMRRSFSDEEVRNRMVVLSACLRPNAFQIASSGEPEARAGGRAVVTVNIRRDSDTHTLPFRTIRGREDRWFIEQIELGSFSC